MGSPPHPWAPTQTDSNASPPGRPFLPSCQGRQETHQQHFPEPCLLKGTPHKLYYARYTMYLMCFLSPLRCLYRNQLVARSPHHTLSPS